MGLDSKKLSANFHDTIGKSGLSACTSGKWDKAILKQVESLLRKDQKILDVGCGYGRISVPLLGKGYDVYGIDISKVFITGLKSELSFGKLRQRFKVADMCDLPFGNNTFDVALCLWSSFDSLLLRKEQVLAIKEMKRVLKRGGFAFIEGFSYMVPTPEDIANGNLRGHRNRVRRDYAEDKREYFHYNHDEDSMRKILSQARIRHFSVAEEWFGWRERLIVRFRK